MDVAAVQNTTTQVDSSSTQTLGKDDFLKLLTEQLKNQDPTNPLDDTAFVSQLAQFSSLEQAMTTNDKLSAMQLSESAMVNAQVASLVGKSVLVRTQSVIMPASGTPPPITLQLGADASKVSVSIQDASGTVVRVLDAGALAAGTQTVAWDGKNTSGNRVPAGSYTVAVTATDAQGQAVTVNSEVTGVVTGVAFDTGSAQLELGGSTRVNPSDVVEITNP